MEDQRDGTVAQAADRGRVGGAHRALVPPTASAHTLERPPVKIDHKSQGRWTARAGGDGLRGLGFRGLVVWVWGLGVGG